MDNPAAAPAAPANPQDPAPSPSPSPSPSPAPPADPTPKPAESWRDGITDDGLKNFAKNYNSIEDVVKSTFQFRQKLSNAISIPGKDATEDDIKAFRTKLGVPDTADGYTYKKPEGIPDEAFEGLDESMKALKASLHKEGATPQVASAVFDNFFGMIKGAYDREQAALETNIKNGEIALRKEWGKDFDANMEYAKRGFTQFGDEAFEQLINSTKVGGVELANHPVFSKVFSSVGRKMGEGGLQTIIGEGERQSTEQKMDELTKQAHSALDSGDKNTADRLFQERDVLSKSYYGTN